MKNVVSIILEAGKGKRLNSKNIPKVMLEIDNKPIIDYCVKTLEDIDVERIIVVIGFKGNLIKKYLGDRVEYVEQKKQLGTGHAVIQAKKALKALKGYVLISYGDMPFLTKRMYLSLLNKCKKKKLSGCILTVDIKKDAPEWGRIIRNEEDQVLRIVEHKDANSNDKKITEMNTGIYCFKVNDLLKYLSKIDTKNVQNEYYLTDIIEIMSKAGLKIDTVITSDLKNTLGVNRPEELAKARALAK